MGARRRRRGSADLRGAVLHETVRESDVAARWGGEEFALVLTNTGSAGGASFAERARAAIEACTLQMPDGEE